MARKRRFRWKGIGFKSAQARDRFKRVARRRGRRRR